MLRNYVYDTKLLAYQPYFLRSLVAAYFIKARSTMAAAMSGHLGVAGDFIYWDASRVSSKEVLLIHVWAANQFVCAPLQVLPDQSSVHSPAEAVDNVAKVILPLSKKPRTNRPRKRGADQLRLSCSPLPNPSRWSSPLKI